MIASSVFRPIAGRRVLGLLVACLFAGASPGALAATITVDTLADHPVGTPDEGCTLRDAVAAANGDAASGGCVAGNGADEIVFADTLFEAIDANNEALQLTEAAEFVLTGVTTINGEVEDPDPASEADPVRVTIDGGGGRFDTAEDDPTDGNRCLTVDDVADGEPAPRQGRLFRTQAETTLSDLILVDTCIENADGGAILNEAALTVTDTVIVNANATDPDLDRTDGRGGAIFNAATGTLVLNDATSIRSSFSATAGGAIANDNPNADLSGADCSLDRACTISLADTSFLANAAGRSETDSVVLASGGAIHNPAGVITGNTVTFSSRNSAAISGGAIWNNGTVELVSASLLGNFARAFDDDPDTPEVPPAGGGAIFNDADGVVRVEFATFSENGAFTAEEFLGDIALGGAILNDGGSVTLDTVALTANRAGRPEFESSDGTTRAEIPGRGGAVFTQNGSFTILDSTVIGNNSQSQAGAIWAGTGNLDIQRSGFLENVALGGNEDATVQIGGGALHSTGQTTISGSRFLLNRADGENGAGGAILVAGGTVDITDSEIARNDAAFGAGIDNAGGLILARSVLGSSQVESNNIARFNGGGLHNREGADATIDDATVSFNEAADGGGVWNAGTLRIDNSTLSQNNASAGTDANGDGGALFQAAAGSANLRFVTVTANSAEGSGAGIAVADTANPVTIESSVINGVQTDATTVDDNSLVDDGGADLEPLQLYGGVTETHPLGPDSLALDLGDNGVCGGAPIDNLDQRGATRPFDGDEDDTADCDAGSFERTDDPVLTVNRNGPNEDVVELGQDIAVLGFTLTNEGDPDAGDPSINVDGFNTRPLFNGGVEALRRLTVNDPAEADSLQFDVVLDDNGNGEIDSGETVPVGTGDGRSFDCTDPTFCVIEAGDSEDFLIVLRTPEDPDADTASLFSAPPVLAGGLLVGLLGLVRIRGLQRRTQWLLLVTLLTGTLAACSDSSSIDDIEPPAPPVPDPSLQGQLRFELFQLRTDQADRILIGDGLPIYGPQIRVP